jgi:transposase
VQVSGVWGKLTLRPGRTLILVWDNLNSHRSKKMRAFTEGHPDWLTVVHLPGYAPDLNAVEGTWATMKSSLGNHAATTLDELESMVRSSAAYSRSGSGTPVLPDAPSGAA